ncbi:YbbR-like domain-containing protein [bacterium]|nr:YbbR-like domain-containing protein [bacterium]
MRIWMIDNLAIKIGALLIALFLWFHAVTEKEYEVKRQVPIQITAIPEDLVLAKPFPTEAVIRLRGKGKQLIIPYLSQIRLLVGANGAQKGTKQTTLSAEHVHIPHGGGALLAEIISPRKLDLNFDSLLKKKVPVRSSVGIELSDGFVRGDPIAFKPDSVLVQGPAQQVKSIEFVSTDSVNFHNVTETIATMVNLAIPEGFNITCIPREINTIIDIQRLVQRTIDDIPVTLTHIPTGVTAHLNPSVISLTISGGERYLSSLTKDNFSASADYRRARRKTDNLISARINLPPEVELTSAEPRMFKVARGS